MKVKVLVNFRDKHSNELMEAGKVIEVSRDRYEEITESGEFVELIKEKKVYKEEKTEE